MDADTFVANVLEEVPEVAPILGQHVQDFDELLLHVFVADLRRLCEAAWASNDRDLLQRLLISLDDALTSGDESVENAVAVSFVEDSGWWDPVNAAYIASWPEGLRAEVEKQEAWRPRQPGGGEWRS